MSERSDRRASVRMGWAIAGIGASIALTGMYCEPIGWNNIWAVIGTLIAGGEVYLNVRHWYVLAATLLLVGNFLGAWDAVLTILSKLLP